ncbi:MAG: hypothetical protein ABI402_11395 [Ferruginibacter sp.]
MKFLKYPASLIIAVIVLFSFPTGKKYKQQVDHSIKQYQSIDKWDMLIQSGAAIKTFKADLTLRVVEGLDNKRHIQIQ